jgi:hypothetical protein
MVAGAAAGRTSSAGTTNNGSITHGVFAADMPCSQGLIRLTRREMAKCSSCIVSSSR